MFLHFITQPYALLVAGRCEGRFSGMSVTQSCRAFLLKLSAAVLKLSLS